MKKKRIFWIAASIILLLGFAFGVIFLRPTRPVVSVAERMAVGEEDTRTLIVVYSYSGNTRRVAQILQNMTGGDLLEINTRAGSQSRRSDSRGRTRHHLGALPAQPASGREAAGNRHRIVHRQDHPGCPRHDLWRGLPGRVYLFLVPIYRRIKNFRFATCLRNGLIKTITESCEFPHTFLTNSKYSKNALLNRLNIVDYIGGMAAMAAQTRIERAAGLLPSLDVDTIFQ